MTRLHVECSTTDIDEQHFKEVDGEAEKMLFFSYEIIDSDVERTRPIRSLDTKR